MEGQLIELIDDLLEKARPGGLAHARLRKYRDQASRNVMLGPSVMRYIKRLQTIASDTIECKFLDAFGKCRRRRNLACDHVDNNKACKLYEPSKPQMKGDPLGRTL